MATEREVAVTLDRDTALQGKLAVPGGAVGLVVLSEGPGDGQQAAGCEPLVLALGEAGLATLRLDLLTAQEEARRRKRDLCFNVGLLAMRMARVVPWLRWQPETCELPVALLGVGEAADAALMAAAVHPRGVSAVVAYGGRSRVVPERLRRCQVPTLLLADRGDARLFRQRREALAAGQVRLELVAGTPLPMAQVAAHCGPWLLRHLRGAEDAVALAAPGP